MTFSSEWLCVLADKKNYVYQSFFNAYFKVHFLVNNYEKVTFLTHQTLLKI